MSSRLSDAFREAQAAHEDQSGSWPRAWVGLLRREMQFERRFAAAGGRLMAGADPTGWGGTVAGFGDQRELELLVEAGFSPEAAVKIATANGAAFLGERHLGSLAAGNAADMVVVRGDPAAHIADIRNVELVFKDGVGYDPQALIESAAGSVGEYDFRVLLRFPWNVVFGILLVWLGSRIIRTMRRRSGAPVAARV